MVRSNLSSDQTVGKDKYAKLQQYQLERGDVVMARRGEMGRVAIVDAKADGYLCGSGSLYFRPDTEQVIPEFLAAALSSPRGRRELENSSLGVTMANLNSTIVEQFEAWPAAHRTAAVVLYRPAGALPHAPIAVGPVRSPRHTVRFVAAAGVSGGAVSGSQFSFLEAEFGEQFEAAERAERYALADPGTAVIHARRALESGVKWVYAHDRSLVRRTTRR
jgi:hypothetical protein